MRQPEYYNTVFNYLKGFLEEYKISAAMVLGSGLGGFENEFNTVKTIYTKDIPDYPQSTVLGHAGKIILSELDGKYYLIFSGRIHLYEGYSIDKVLILTAIVKHFNIPYFTLTNAVGGISSGIKPGDLVLMDDIYLLHYLKVFRELGETNLLSKVIDTEFNDKIFRVATERNINLKRGVFGFMLGPTYETPAEINALKIAGCDTVGMSTAPELLYAKKIGLKAIAVSAVTNYAAGISDEKISHDHVQHIAKQIKEKFSALLKIIIGNI